MVACRQHKAVKDIKKHKNTKTFEFVDMQIVIYI
jgi:hypothetical protein